MNSINKYVKYQSIKHSWEGMNCLTLLEYLYQVYLGIDFSDMWKRIGRKDGNSGVDQNWTKKYGKYFLREKENWQKVELTELREFDILVFAKNNIPYHFGMYIGNNYYIHILEHSMCQISMLNDDARNNLGGAYRHVKMV